MFLSSMTTLPINKYTPNNFYVSFRKHLTTFDVSFINDNITHKLSTHLTTFDVSFINDNITHK